MESLVPARSHESFLGVEKSGLAWFWPLKNKAPQCPGFTKKLYGSGGLVPPVGGLEKPKNGSCGVPNLRTGCWKSTLLFSPSDPKWKVEDVYTFAFLINTLWFAGFPRYLFMSSDVLHFSRIKWVGFQLSQPEPPVKCCYEKLQTCAGPPGLAFEIKARSELKEQLVVKNPTFKTHNMNIPLYWLVNGDPYNGLL